MKHIIEKSPNGVNNSLIWVDGTGFISYINKTVNEKRWTQAEEYLKYYRFTPFIESNGLCTYNLVVNLNSKFDSNRYTDNMGMQNYFYYGIDRKFLFTHRHHQYVIKFEKYATFVYKDEADAEEDEENRQNFMKEYRMDVYGITDELYKLPPVYINGGKEVTYFYAGVDKGILKLILWVSDGVVHIKYKEKDIFTENFIYGTKEKITGRFELDVKGVN